MGCFGDVWVNEGNATRLDFGRAKDWRVGRRDPLACFVMISDDFLNFFGLENFDISVYYSVQMFYFLVLALLQLYVAIVEPLIFLGCDLFGLDE